MSHIAGGYTTTLDGNAAGELHQGWEIQHQFFKEIVRGDNFAEGAQDAVYQGYDVFGEGILNEYDAAGFLNFAQPYGPSLFASGIVGRLDVGSSIAAAFILTALVGTPAAAKPASVTFAQSVIAENFPVRLLFRPAHRRVPVRLRHYPASISDPASVSIGVLT